MDFFSVIDILNEDNSINCVSYAITPWHAHGVNVATEYLKQKGIVVNNIVYTTPHPVSNIQIDKSYFKSDGLKGYYECDILARGIAEKVDILAKLLNTSKEKSYKRTIYFVYPLRVPYIDIIEIEKRVLDAKVVSIVIDEGIGNYFKRSIKFSFNKKTFFEMCNLTINKVFELQNRKRLEVANLCLFLKNAHGELSANGVAVELYKRELSVQCSNGDVEKLDYRDSIVYCCQDYYSTGKVVNNEDLNIIKRISELCKMNGLKLILKIHPREMKPERYNVIDNIVIDSRRQSLESIISNGGERPLLIVGVATTLLVTLKLFYDLPTVMVGRLLSKSSVSKDLLWDILEFERLFANQVECVSDYNDLEEIICNQRG